MKFADLTLREKLEYIWMYYKFHILAAVAIVIGGVYAISTMTSRQPSVLNVLVVSNNVAPDSVSGLQQEAERLFVPQHQRETVDIECLPVQGSLTNAQNYPVVMKLLAMVAGHDVDVVITDHADFRQLAKQGMFVPLSQAAGSALRSHPDLGVALAPGKPAVGVDLHRSAVFQRLVQAYGDNVAGIVHHAPHPAIASRFVEWLAGS